MRRPVTEVLRRSFDITLANWPLILIRIAESVVMTIVLIVSIVAALIPLAVSAGLSKDEIEHAANPAEVVATILVQHWIVLLSVFVFALLVIGFLMAIHCFVQGGSAQIYLDAERGARGLGGVPPRDAWAAFRGDRWLGGGRKSWWSIFWIYNLAGSLGALIILVPLLVTIALMLAAADGTVKIVAGCAGLLLAFVVMIPIGIIVGIWCEKAIAVTVARSTGPRDSLRAAWNEMKGDFGRHLGVTLVITIAGFAVIAMLSGLSFPMSMAGRSNHLPMLPLMMAPMQLSVGLLQSVVSAVVASLLLAAFVDLTEDR